LFLLFIKSLAGLTRARSARGARVWGS
jgi:hypothetical protein